MHNGPIHDCAAIRADGGSHFPDCQLAIARGSWLARDGDFIPGAQFDDSGNLLPPKHPGLVCKTCRIADYCCPHCYHATGGTRGNRLLA